MLKLVAVRSIGPQSHHKCYPSCSPFLQPTSALTRSPQAPRSKPVTHHAALKSSWRAPHRRRTTDRDFVPWRFLDAGRSSGWLPLYSPASKNLHRTRRSSAISATNRRSRGMPRFSDWAVLEIDHQLVFGRPFKRKVGRVCTVQNLNNWGTCRASVLATNRGFRGPAFARCPDWFWPKCAVVEDCCLWVILAHFMRLHLGLRPSPIGNRRRTVHLSVVTLGAT
jgi:hypothetical protein